MLLHQFIRVRDTHRADQAIIIIASSYPRSVYVSYFILQFYVFFIWCFHFRELGARYIFRLNYIVYVLSVYYSSMFVNNITCCILHRCFHASLLLPRPTECDCANWSEMFTTGVTCKHLKKEVLNRPFYHVYTHFFWRLLAPDGTMRWIVRYWEQIIRYLRNKQFIVWNYVTICQYRREKQWKITWCSYRYEKIIILRILLNRP